MLNFVAVGDMGKSALTWKWFNRNTRPGEREDMLLAILDRELHLLVLDGLERILRKLAKVRAARILVSTRLFPAELQLDTLAPCPASGHISSTGCMMMTRWRCGAA